MKRKPRLPVLLAALAITAFMTAGADAATQILGLVASNGVPTPLRCEDGLCRGFFSSFCLQQERSTPALDGEYRLASGGGLTIVARRTDGSVFRLPGDGLVSINVDAGFTSVTISLPEARLKALGGVSAAIAVAPLTSILPLPTAGDSDPQTRDDIAYATGPLRRLGERTFEARGRESDAARLLALLVNTLPDVSPQTVAERQVVWHQTLAWVGRSALDPAGVAEVAHVYDECGAKLMVFGLKSCIKLHHAELMTNMNRGFWDSLGGS